LMRSKHDLIAALPEATDRAILVLYKRQGS
jgi:hypothetical protein